MRLPGDPRVQRTSRSPAGAGFVPSARHHPLGEQSRGPATRSFRAIPDRPIGERCPGRVAPPGKLVERAASAPARSTLFPHSGKLVGWRAAGPAGSTFFPPRDVQSRPQRPTGRTQATRGEPLRDPRRRLRDVRQTLNNAFVPRRQPWGRRRGPRKAAALPGGRRRPREQHHDHDGRQRHDADLALQDRRHQRALLVRRQPADLFV